MLYRNFVIATLLAAPIIVMAMQTVLPNAAQPVVQAAPTMSPAIPPPTVPVPVAPPIAPPMAAASTFGQPMAEAGKPMLSPGAGLPEQTAPLAPGGMAVSSSSAQPGSANTE